LAAGASLGCLDGCADPPVELATRHGRRCWSVRPSDTLRRLETTSEREKQNPAMHAVSALEGGAVAVAQEQQL